MKPELYEAVQLIRAVPTAGLAVGDRAIVIEYLEVILRDRLRASMEQIVAFCDRWHITEFALFGSVLREDFQPDTSDIDVLVSFAPDARRGLMEWMAMKEELEYLFQRNVDFVSKAAIQESYNWLRKNNILNSAQVIYDSQSQSRILDRHHRCPTTDSSNGSVLDV